MFPFLNKGVDSTLEPAYLVGEQRLEKITVYPSTEDQILTATGGYSGFSEIDMPEVTSSIDSYIIPENIRNDTSILGVWGTFVPGGDDTVIYGFRVDTNNAVGQDVVTYLSDAVDMVPASMGESSFNYGSWEDAFFMPKPCIIDHATMKVKYYLDPNDYSKKLDGTPSEYDDLDSGASVMMEFPKIWYKFVQNGALGSGEFYCSNKKIDDTYHCWCNVNSQGQEIDHFYISAYYGGFIIENEQSFTWRALSGKTLYTKASVGYSTSATYEVGDIVQNGCNRRCLVAIEEPEEFDPNKWEILPTYSGYYISQVGGIIKSYESSPWMTTPLSDVMLLSGLLILMSKSLDLQSSFGRGICSGGEAAATSYVTGGLDDKGLFWGSTSSDSEPVKVFGIENFWGCLKHYVVGLNGSFNGSSESDKKFYYKSVKGMTDFSLTENYNPMGGGYIGVTPSVTSNASPNNYITTMVFGEFGMLPVQTGTEANSLWKATLTWGTNYLLFGGSANDGDGCGLNFDLSATSSYQGWEGGFTFSLKPYIN